MDLSTMLDFVEAVEGGDAVALGVSRVVEDLVYKVIDMGIEAHGHLSNVDHFCGAAADHMDP